MASQAAPDPATVTYVSPADVQRATSGMQWASAEHYRDSLKPGLLRDAWTNLLAKRDAERARQSVAVPPIHLTPAPDAGDVVPGPAAPDADSDMVAGDWFAAALAQMGAMGTPGGGNVAAPLVSPPIQPRREGGMNLTTVLFWGAIVAAVVWAYRRWGAK